MNTDIIYTPLDVPPQPNIDVEKFKRWLADTYEKTSQFRSILSGNNQTAEAKINNYPWNLTTVYHQVDFGGQITGPGWTCTFQDDWPELADYIPRAFGLELSHIGNIIFLPVRAGHTGVGFWHNDPEPHGLRFYIDFEHVDKNKLLMRRTKTRNEKRPTYQYPMDTEQHLQPEVLECKLANPRQAFFLNNYNAVHTTWTEVPNVTRIAAFITCKPSTSKKVTEIVTPLVEHSAKKFKEYSLYWKDESKE